MLLYTNVNQIMFNCSEEAERWKTIYLQRLEDFPEITRNGH